MGRQIIEIYNLTVLLQTNYSLKNFQDLPNGWLCLLTS